MPTELFTPADLDRLIRIRNEAVGDPNQKILPKRIYPDDVVFVIDLLWQTVRRIDKLKEPEPQESDS